MVSTKYTNEIAEIIKKNKNLFIHPVGLKYFCDDLIHYFKKINPEFFKEEDFSKKCGVEE